MVFNNLSGCWWQYAYLSGNYRKFVLKKVPMAQGDLR